jgi:hypothetical protein
LLAVLAFAAAGWLIWVTVRVDVAADGWKSRPLIVASLTVLLVMLIFVFWALGVVLLVEGPVTILGEGAQVVGRLSHL